MPRSSLETPRSSQGVAPGPSREHPKSQRDSLPGAPGTPKEHPRASKKRPRAPKELPGPPKELPGSFFDTSEPFATICIRQYKTSRRLPKSPDERPRDTQAAPPQHPRDLQSTKWPQRSSQATQGTTKSKWITARRNGTRRAAVNADITGDSCGHIGTSSNMRRSRST